MLHEGERVGLFVVGRRSAGGFTEDGLRRARQVAFAVAAPLNRHRHEEQRHRYALMLGLVVDVDERLLRGEPVEQLLQAVIDAACIVAGCRGGLLVLQTPHGPEAVAANGDAFAPAVGRPAPSLASPVVRRLSAERMLDVAESLGVVLPFGSVRLVPLATPERAVGCLALLDGGLPTMDDRLVEAFASRAALTLRFALGQRPSA
jgi:GAF domain-containing protein